MHSGRPGVQLSGGAITSDVTPRPFLAVALIETPVWSAGPLQDEAFSELTRLTQSPDKFNVSSTSLISLVSDIWHAPLV